MGAKPNDNRPVLTLAQLARLARYIFAGLGGANNNRPTRRGLQLFRGIDWHNTNNRANPRIGQLIGMIQIIARQIDRKTPVVSMFDPL
jgi:hypothetical protein